MGPSHRRNHHPGGIKKTVQVGVMIRDGARSGFHTECGKHCAMKPIRFNCFCCEDSLFRPRQKRTRSGVRTPQTKFKRVVQMNFCRCALKGCTESSGQRSAFRVREDFAAFVEWVLVNNDCPFTVCPSDEDLTIPTPNPEPSQPSPLFCTEYAPEPTAAAEPEHVTECNITTEPELSDVTDQSPLVLSSSPASPKLPPSFPLLPPLNPASSSVLSLLAPAPPRRKDIGSPPPASKSWTPPGHPTSSTGLPCPSGSTLAPPSLRLHLSPQSLWLHRGLPDPRLHLGRLSLQLHLGPPDPQSHPRSAAVHLHPGLLFLWLRLHQSAPCCHLPYLHHGSSFRRLHRGSLSWLVSGSPPGTSLVLPPFTLPWPYELYPFLIACPSPAPRPPPELPPSLLFWTVCPFRALFCISFLFAPHLFQFS
ncbi:Streptococcal surface protein A [Labeo rohita]|uniref:Streptococcal surface protein A n=1 Tax=Labeo rohita TaxID=84645 RepID=A0ABQ8LIS3_LABRO|nr:Streptococcal surface protein A [Labeo rohita]